MKTTPLSPLRFAGLHENLGVNGGLFCSTIIGIRSGVVRKIMNVKLQNLATKKSN